nr:hypothetical protein [Tanacetum cinerariifolium]
MLVTIQGMSYAKIEQIVAQRVTNAIKAIAIYKARICLAHDSTVRTVHQEAKLARNANNKRKGFALVQQVRLHHVQPCTLRCNNCKRVGHMTKIHRNSVPATTRRALEAN